jgi:hypothetical protein
MHISNKIIQKGDQNVNRSSSKVSIQLDFPHVKVILRLITRFQQILLVGAETIILPSEKYIVFGSRIGDLFKTNKLKFHEFM